MVKNSSQKRNPNEKGLGNANDRFLFLSCPYGGEIASAGSEALSQTRELVAVLPIKREHSIVLALVRAVALSLSRTRPQACALAPSLSLICLRPRALVRFLPPPPPPAATSSFSS